MKKLTKYLLATTLALGSTGVVVGRGGLDPNVPHYFLDKEMCARYARLAAEDLSGTKYTGENAWNLSKVNKLEAEVSNWGELRALEESGKLVPKASILTLYNPHSKHSVEDRKVTHAVLYIGEGNVAHQEGRWQIRNSFKDLQDKGYVPREVLSPKEK